jgi:FlaA1/EpsC-like NDP-sugar epimerase
VTLGVGVLRFHSRLFAWQRAAGRLGLRVAIIGSRDAAAAAVRDMLHNPRAGLVPVVAFDDDPRVHGLSLVGVPVVGGIDEIPVVADQYSIQQVLLTVTNPSSELIERSLRAAESAGVALKILPGVREIVGAVGHPAVVDRVREPRIEDLLGRKEVLTDLEAVRQSLVGHRVVITGAGGSIGSEIARQVASFQPEVSILVDHDETHLHDVATFLSGRSETVLLDIRDRDAVFDAFSTYRPDVVFHAAAHKHVPVLEAHPIEAVTTNVFGTLNVVEAAVSQGVKQFVFISTDKAVQASSVMGAAKAVGERIVLDRRPADADYCAVRFGNVLGSRGSVIPTFKRQIALGGPVTVTDARMTRYFMSVEEAVQLVLQASVLEADRGIFMLEMGEPVRILDLAQRMIRLSGYSVGTDIPIRMTGIRSGEKLYEELSAPDERVESTTHPSILHLVPTINDHGALQLGLAALDGAVARRDKPAARELLFDLARHQRQGVGA